MCFILRMIYFSLSWKKKVRIIYFHFLEKKNSFFGLYIFHFFGKKKFHSSDYIFFTFWKKMGKRMKFLDDISDYFQMTTQFERKSRKFATTSTVYNVEITPFPENMIEEPLTFCQELFDRIVDY